MNARFPLPALLFMLACQPVSGEKAGLRAGETGAEDHETGIDTADTAPQDCGVLQGLEILPSAEVFPGSTLTLLATLSNPVDDLTLEWSVPDGSLSEPTLKGSTVQVEWTLGLERDPHLPQIDTLTVKSRAPGCLDEQAETQVEVAWPERMRVVVLYNPEVEGSEDVANYYADFREIPGTALCGISSSDPVTLPGTDFPGWIESVESCIEAVGPQVWYLVPVFGVPYKVSDRIQEIGGSGAIWTVSLDALAFLGRRAVSRDQAMWNPIRLEGSSMASSWPDYLPLGELRASDRNPVYLVSRIDGASAEAAMELVDRTREAEILARAGALDGIVYVDGNRGDKPPATDEFGSYEAGEWNMWGTRSVFTDLGWYEVVWDGNAQEFGTAPAPTDCPNALYYAGWYSFYNYNDCFTWTTGAVGGHLDSCSACEIRGGTAWAGRALEEGITATFGAVNEPYVAGMPEYDQLFLYLTQGANFAEAGYESTMIALWMMVWVGDPLYRPYPVSQ